MSRSRRYDLPPPRGETYRHLTQRPLYGLAFCLAPLAVYHFGALRYGTKVLAPLHMRWALEHLNATGWFLPPLAIVVVLLAQHLLHRHRWSVRPAVLAGMLAESLLWVVPLYCLNLVNDWLFRPVEPTSRAVAMLAAGGGPRAADLFTAMGAGVYEEFLFRLVLISLVLLVLVDFFRVSRGTAAAVAVILSGVLFSLYHFSWFQLTGQEMFHFGLFVFRALAGVYLGGLFVHRGFGVAVGTHMAWNVAVALTA